MELLKIVGSPFTPEVRQGTLQEKELRMLYLHAVKNRMRLLYLETLKEREELFDLKPRYREQYSRYLKIFDAMVRVSNFLDSLDVEHAIFKSIRPYPSATVDVDTLVFDSDEYQEAVKAMLKAGWEMLGYGPQSITFFDSEAKVGIDLYREVAVSWVVYLDKRKLERYVIRMMLPNKEGVSTLRPEADLVAIIAHSVIKEQVYTLAEFYTFLWFLKIMKMKEVENLAELIKMNNLMVAAKSFVSLTLALHNEAFGFVPAKLAVLSSELGRNGLEEKRLTQNAFQIPHKYHFLTLLKSLIDKLKEEKTRKSLALQGFEMMNPHFTKTVFAGLVDHMIRETY